MSAKNLSWICQLITSVILLQTLFFKFSGAAESVYIFSELGMEPWGRIGSGVVELIAGLLLLSPTFRTLGALLALGVISGAILAHLLFLGLVIMNDNGQLFIMALMSSKWFKSSVFRRKRLKSLQMVILAR
ncbi:MAG: DoxX family protein [Aureispira sp.]|nr:DoxX family protein [Aureispira sp.]